MQEEMIARLETPPHVIRLDCGHLAPVTHPRYFAGLLAAGHR
jgi:hypothetical protein